MIWRKSNKPHVSKSKIIEVISMRILGNFLWPLLLNHIYEHAHPTRNYKKKKQILYILIGIYITPWLLGCEHHLKWKIWTFSPNLVAYTKFQFKTREKYDVTISFTFALRKCNTTKLGTFFRTSENGVVIFSECSSEPVMSRIWHFWLISFVAGLCIE